MNTSSMIKKPELFSNLSQGVKKVLYPERDKGQTYDASIEYDSRYTPSNTISHNQTMGKEITIKPNLSKLHSDTMTNQTNEKPTFYSQNQIDLQGEIEELTMGLQTPINPPLIVNPGKFVYFDL